VTWHRAPSAPIPARRLVAYAACGYFFPGALSGDGPARIEIDAGQKRTGLKAEGEPEAHDLLDGGIPLTVFDATQVARANIRAERDGFLREPPTIARLAKLGSQRLPVGAVRFSRRPCHRDSERSRRRLIEAVYSPAS
jgi:hypothetical protein